MSGHGKKSGGTAGRIYLHHLLLVLAAVLLTGGVSLYLILQIRRNDMDTQIRDIARTTADMEIVRAALRSGDPESPVSGELSDSLDSFIRTISQVDIIVVCDMDSIRYYHNDHDRIGQHFQGGDEAPVLGGSAPYISEAEGTLGMQRRAFCPVFDEDGAQLGFVMASVLTTSLVRILRQVTVTYLFILLMLLAAGALLAAAFMRGLQRTLLGYRPEEFARRYVERAEVLDAMEEGICAINSEEKIIVLNRAARTLLGIPKDAVPEDRPIRDFIPGSSLLPVLQTGKAEYNVSETAGQRHLLSTRIPLRSDGQLIGAVSIMRDKTELTAMAEKLTGANYMVDTLRAFNHEFKNKLHIILGFLEMNQPQKAKSYILETTLLSGEAVSAITRLIPLPDLAALLIGKVIRANELGITFLLKQDSYFRQSGSGLPADCFITVVGNLVENAMDELNSADFAVKEIELGLYVDESTAIISCDDTGGGIPEEILIRLYDRHTTTKGEGHGMGFARIREIVDSYGGVIHIDTEQGMGTSIEITIPIL